MPIQKAKDDLYRKVFLKNPAEGLEQTDDPAARPIEDFIPADEQEDWAQFIEELTGQATYAIRKRFKNGEVAKTPILCLIAKDEEEALAAFTAANYYWEFPESAKFVAERITQRPKGCDVMSAEQLINQGPYVAE